MIRQHRSFSLAVLILMGLFSTAFADWQSVGDGFDYQYFRIEGDVPNDVYVSRMLRSNTNCIIESSIGQGKLREGRETVTGMAARYNDAINWWGQEWGKRNKVVVAVNGDYFNLTTGVPTSGQIHSGWFCWPYLFYAGGSGFVWTVNRQCFLGGNVDCRPATRLVRFQNGNTAVPDKVNDTRNSGELVLYTPQYADKTYTSEDGVEVVVEMTRPTVVLPGGNNYSEGTIREVRTGGSSWIPFDHVVLSGNGGPATVLRNNAVVGQKINIQMRIVDYGTTGLVPTPSMDWTKAYAGIGGHVYCLKNGVITMEWDDTARHPRTVVAFNDNYIFFVVVDGRTTRSFGMKYSELGAFCRDYISAKWAISQDGGGSSVMVVNGQIMNRPSDGTERAVANGLMMVNVQPKLTSTLFRYAQQARTKGTTQIRLGPGTHFPVMATVSDGLSVTLANHSLKGIFAKGQYWCRGTVGGYTGWISQSSLMRTDPTTTLWMAQ